MPSLLTTPSKLCNQVLFTPLEGVVSRLGISEVDYINYMYQSHTCSCMYLETGEFSLIVHYLDGY